MNSFLLCMFGPLKGNRVTLSEAPIVLGRERNNEVYIGDLLLSRKHCSIEKQDDAYAIRDLGSRNGVFVNGIPVHRRRLEHGDRIEIGSSTFLFLAREDTSGPEFPVVDESIQAGSTLTLRVDDSLPPEDTPSPRAGDFSKALVGISRALSGATDVPAFFERLFDSLSRLIPSEHAAILEPDETKILAWRSADQRPIQRISLSLCERARSGNVAVLASDLSLPDSLSGSPLTAVLCVPFAWLGRILCLLYLDTSDPSGFGQNHLEIASAVAALSSPVLQHLRDAEQLRLQKEELQERVLGSRPIIGESPAIRKILQLISRIGPTDTTILIYGESGTGKELAARAIHSASPRRAAPLIAMSCAAIPESLLESELFGYEKGAFTGAVGRKKGKIESANGGTLFLDEIGELAPSLQAKLLRVLQEHEFERVGGIHPVHVDMRIIAATNRNLEQMIEEGKFRRDLFYRLNVVTVSMPPLRELGEDILLLSHYFLSQFTRKIGRRIQGISASARDCLLGYDWPGNVRELQNALERAVALGVSDSIELEDLPEALLERRPIPSNSRDLSYQDAVVRLKRELILKAFAGTKGNYNEAAARLGLNPNHLYRLVKNLNLKDQI